MSDFLSGALSLGGAVVDKIFGDERVAGDREFQREMAKHGLRWRMEDADAAGVHRLAALGMNPVQGSPSMVGDTNFQQLGQDVSRAIQAGSTEAERLQIRLLETQVEGNEIDNAIRLSRLARTQGDQVPPPKPGVAIQPSKPVVSVAGGGAELGLHPEVTFGGTMGGTIVPYPSQQFQDYLSESFVPNALWMARNLFIPPGGMVGPPQESASQAGRTPGDFTWVPGFGWVPTK